MDIKDNIKTICKAQGRTFADLANELSVTRQTLFRQVTGNTTTDTLKRIANALNVAPFILLHPDPARAMQEADGRQDYKTAGGIQTAPADPDNPGTQAQPRPAPPVPAVCPVCHTRLLVSIQPAPDTGRPSSMEPDAHTTPEILTDQDRTSDGQTNGTTDEGRPEEMKLFEE